MTVCCIHCGGESRVVLTRRTMHVEPDRKKQRHAPNITRTRQCVNCRWKWKTIERTHVEKARHHARIKTKPPAKASQAPDEPGGNEHPLPQVRVAQPRATDHAR